MQNIQLSYPSYFLIFIAIIAGIFALSLYLNEGKLKENKRWLPSLLGLLRWLSVLLILFLLLMPLFKMFSTEKEMPIVLIAKDVSNSIEMANDTNVVNGINRSIEELKNKYSDKFVWEELYFGQDILTNNGDSINSLSTNISKSLEFISEQYEDQNLGAVILSTDGIFNEGKNPIYSNYQLQAPIHTIALGDTSRRKDILIKNVFHNRIVYLNDKFTIEVDVQANNSKGIQTNLVLYKIEKDKRTNLKSSKISIDDDRFFNSYKFELEAQKVGNTKYLISVETIPNEISTINNNRNIYIEVLDARQKILLLCHSPHPDIKSLKSIIESNKNYELEIIYANKAVTNVADHDIVILHNLPSQAHSIDEVLSSIQKSKIPTFFIIGNEIQRQLFNSNQNVLTLAGNNFSLNDVTPIVNRTFSIFTLSENLIQNLSSFVPIKSPFGEYSPGPATQILLSQKIGSVETQYPLLAFSDINGQKQAVLAGEGIWKWNLMEYYEDKNQESLTKEIIQKTIQYISQKEDKRQFRVFSNKKDYKENESIFIDAQLYNDNFELINSPDASLNIINEQNQRFEYVFTKSENYYVLNAGRFPEGNYSYSASVNYNGKNLRSEGSFSVQSITKEEYDLTARHDILHSLSNNTGGTILYPQNIASLDTLIGNSNSIKPILYQKAETKPLLHWPWILFAILILLSIEWFLRRYFGSY